MNTRITQKDIDAGKLDFSDIATGKRIAPVHPGKVLGEMIGDLGVTPYRVAKTAGVAQTRIGEIIAGKRAISADTSIRLGRVFGQSDRFWLNLQAAYDVACAEIGDGAYDQIEPLELTGG